MTFFGHGYEISVASSELIQRDKFKSFLMCAFQNHGRSHTSRKSLFPTQGTQAPLVAVFEPFESELRSRGYQVVTLFEREIQEVLRDASTNDMTSMVLMICLAAAISEKSSQWVIRAWHQLSAKYVEG
jgi:hypothetical protein